MGKAAAAAVVARGGRVLCVSRSTDKLAAARSEIVKNTGCVDVLCVQTYVMDASDEASVEEFARSSILADFAPDGLVVSAAGAAPHGPITSLPTADTQSLFGSKFWSAYHCCKHLAPLLTDGGSIALVAGLLNRRPGINCVALAPSTRVNLIQANHAQMPGINCVPLATVNGALEGLTRALALEFGPRLRVNCTTPHHIHRAPAWGSSY